MFESTEPGDNHSLTHFVPALIFHFTVPLCKFTEQQAGRQLHNYQAKEYVTKPIKY